MSDFAWRRRLIARQTIGCRIQRRRTRALRLPTAQRSRAALVFRSTRVAAVLRPGSAPRIHNHILMRYELSVHLHFAGAAGTVRSTGQLPRAVIFMRSAAMPLGRASRATSRELGSRRDDVAVLQSVRLLLPTAAAQQVPQPALASTRWPTLRHRSLRNERNELQTSYSFNEHSERRTSHLRSELVQRHSLTRRRAAGQPPVETVVQPRGMRPRWVPVTPASEPPRISPRHWLRSRRAQTVEMTLPWFNAIERRGMSRSQSQTVVEPRTPPAASLTWRNSVGANAGLASAPPASLPTPAPAPLSALTTVHHHPPQPQPQREAAPAGLNRAAIDRLAEDVMQRLERRVRIERERRGL